MRTVFLFYFFFLKPYYVINIIIKLEHLLLNFLTQSYIFNDLPAITLVILLLLNIVLILNVNWARTQCHNNRVCCVCHTHEPMTLAYNRAQW
jgi:hypothetical protein